MPGDGFRSARSRRTKAGYTVTMTHVECGRCRRDVVGRRMTREQARRFVRLLERLGDRLQVRTAICRWSAAKPRTLPTMLSRTIAIGDIHGCSLALAALIDAILTDPQDTIVPLGDYIDFGLDSRGVLELLIDLGKSCRVVPLLGNHEEMVRRVTA